MAGAGAAPIWLQRAAFAQSPVSVGGRKKILVAIFQRGAADGLNIVVPFSEKRYRELRPTLAIAPPANANGASNRDAIDLDGHLYPQFAGRRVRRRLREVGRGKWTQITTDGFGRKRVLSQERCRVTFLMK